MTLLEQIKHPIKEQLNEFDPYFRNAMKSNNRLLTIILNYILTSKGKQLRPMLVFLSAKLNGQTNNATFVAASLIELLHTATLVHDDVVDESFQRRGYFSVFALWRAKISVLVGDYLLAKGLLLAVDNNQFDLLKIVSQAMREIAEGELLQLEKSWKLNLDEQLYFEIIRKKTATLIAACTLAGTRSVTDNPELLQQMKLFGEYTGVAFQIKDDLFDYQISNLTGKPAGNDLQEKKVTLPLMYAIAKAEKHERRKILKLVNKKIKSGSDIKQIIDFVIEKDGLTYAISKMNEYKTKALDILTNYPDSENKTALMALVTYTTERKK